MEVSSGNNEPRPTTGHHFSSLLQCPQRAWLDYHGDRSLKASPPAFLGKLQQQGLEHERKVVEKFFSDAVTIPSKESIEDRVRLTLQAMRSGADAILQPYFSNSDGRGIADVIELVREDSSSMTGHVYRLGEFKLSNSISTAHVLQVAWYAELLSGIQGADCDDAFFIMGDLNRQTVSLSEVRDCYESCKIQLDELKDISCEPSPHLCRSCVSCSWRDVCVPALVDQQHVSLLPGVSRRLALSLHRSGVTNWQRAIELSDHELEELGFDRRELRQVRDASERLHRGEAVLRYSIKFEELRRLTAISIEFVPNFSDADGYPVPHAVWLESENGPECIPLGTGPAAWPSALDRVFNTDGLAFYGATETVAFLRLMRNNSRKNVHCVDVLDIVEKLVHGPVRGLELRNVMHVADPSSVPPDSSADRVLGLRSVIDWLAGSGGLAV